MPGEAIPPQQRISGIGLGFQLDDRYRNGPKGVSNMLTTGNILDGKRERRPPASKENSDAAPLARAKSTQKRARAVPKEPVPAPPPKMSYLERGTASRGPLNRGPPKTLNELYPWRALADDWMAKATGRLLSGERPPAEWTAQRKAVSQYGGDFADLVTSGAAHESLRRMWQICQSIPGEGSSQEPLYGEINLQGTARLFAIWKELCAFGPDSEFLDVGSGLAKMVFHAAIDPGVRRSHGIEMSQYRANTATSILNLLLPKAGIMGVAERVQLMHGDVKAAASWEVRAVAAGVW